MTAETTPSRTSLENILGSFPYGLFVVVAGSGERASAMVATWAMQVSFKPPLIALALERESRIRKRIDEAGTFSLNLLPASGKATAAVFLKSPVSDRDSIGGRPLTISAHGIPLLGGSASSLGCRVAAVHEAGDHFIYVGEVVDAEIGEGGEILTLKKTGWKYSR